MERRLVLVTVALIGAFLAANLYSQRQLRIIDADAQLVAQRIAPTIGALSNARGAVREIARATFGVARGDVTREEAHRIVAGADLTDRMRALSDGHTELAERARDYQAQALNTIDSGRGEDKLSAMLQQFDESLEQRVRARADDAAQEAERIERWRRHASTLSYSLHGIAAILALLVLAAAMRLSRAHERLLLERAAAIEERNRLTERRAEELELFAARVAHDLKNPLGAIALRVLSAQRSPERGPEVLARVSHNVERMNGIVDELLAFARSGAAPEPGAVTELAPVVDEVLSDTRPTAQAAGVAFGRELRASPVACAPAALHSIVGNLVRNAVKYVADAEGARRVIVRAFDAGSDVRIEIEDTGPGVPPGQEERIFQPYMRATTRQPGLGIGLATVKRLAEGYGGAVGVISGASGGALFWVRLPRAQAEQPVVH
jgi:signal transduction histidine kinase